MGDEDKTMEGEVDNNRVNNLLEALHKVHEYKIEHSDAIFVNHNVIYYYQYSILSKGWLS